MFVYKKNPQLFSIHDAPKIDMFRWRNLARRWRIRRLFKPRVESMSNTERVLAEALRLIAENTSVNTTRRITAVRWFNRLCYDLGAWQRDFIAALKSYPGLRDGATTEEYKEFDAKL